MRIGVIGCGHVGLSTLTAFASKGHEVLGYDVAETAREGICRTLKAACLANDFNDLMFCDIVFECVPTDPVGDSRKCDLSIMDSVVKRFAVLEAASNYRCKVFGQRSTCPPGTARRYSSFFASTAYAVNPSFLRKKTKWEDSVNPERIAIAGNDVALEWLSSAYSEFEGLRFISDNYEVVELLKYLENVTDAVLISLWNEYLTIADSLSISREEFVELVDAFVQREKFGTAIRVPGQAMGMWCLPKDLDACIDQFGAFELHVIRGAAETNKSVRKLHGENTNAGSDLFHVVAGKLKLTAAGRRYLQDARVSLSSRDGI